jgi:hypothetical protein
VCVGVSGGSAPFVALAPRRAFALCFGPALSAQAILSA